VSFRSDRMEPLNLIKFVGIFNLYILYNRAVTNLSNYHNLTENLMCTMFIIKEYFNVDLIIFLLISSAERVCIILQSCVY
jgi:hypothetical protein